MNHSEICPVCNGTGLYKEYLDYVSTTGPVSVRTCHGCNGKGWVTVNDGRSITGSTIPRW